MINRIINQINSGDTGLFLTLVITMGFACVAIAGIIRIILFGGL